METSHRFEEISIGNGRSIFSSSRRRVEYADPYRVDFFDMLATVEQFTRVIKPNLNESERKALVYSEAMLRHLRRISEIQSYRIPSELKQALSIKKKEQHFKLLDNIHLDFNQFMAFRLMAFREYGYSYSMYRFDHDPKNIDQQTLPKLIGIIRDEVIASEETQLSKGQVKSLLTDRK